MGNVASARSGHRSLILEKKTLVLEFPMPQRKDPRFKATALDKRIITRAPITAMVRDEQGWELAGRVVK